MAGDPEPTGKEADAEWALDRADALIEMHNDSQPDEAKDEG